MRYILESTLTTTDDHDNLVKNSYELSLVVSKLRDIDQSAVIYDKKLNMYFEDPLALASIFELELEKIDLNLDKSLAKATDFIQRTFYRYDWTQLRINRRGELIAVENSKEIIKQWKEIQTFLLADYMGEEIKDYIEQIDFQMVRVDFSIKQVAQYFYFGLLFPVIPVKHDVVWHRNRIVALSDIDHVQFDEHIQYEPTDSQSRKYSISGNIIDNKEINVTKYSGQIIVPHDDIHPISAQVELEYNNGYMTVNWDFKLTQYKIN